MNFYFFKGKGYKSLPFWWKDWLDRISKPSRFPYKFYQLTRRGEFATVSWWDLTPRGIRQKVWIYICPLCLLHPCSKIQQSAHLLDCGLSLAQSKGGWGQLWPLKGPPANLCLRGFLGKHCSRGVRIAILGFFASLTDDRLCHATLL